MANPFEAPKPDTLVEAFPNIDPEIIQDVLASVDNNVDTAFEILLSMSDPTATSRQHRRELPTPPLPGRNNSTQHAPVHMDSTNPFLNGTGGCTTRARQDLAQWRQELAHQAKQRRMDIQHRLHHHRISSSSSSAYIEGTPLTEALRAGLKTSAAALSASLEHLSQLQQQQQARCYDLSSSFGHPTTASSLSLSPPQRLRRLSSAPTTFFSMPPPRDASVITIAAPTTPPNRSRPLPPLPPINNSSSNPFVDEGQPPPPAYELHRRDRYIDPREIDTVLRTHTPNT
ncbi:hypothetical protein BX666DRAFT_2027994 [Dichotomocladium elegans]|nr:hypothetical protein BX666DRAFT_2027994 [Dichotomocladium elegans]